MHLNKIFWSLLLMVTAGMSCKKFVEVDAPRNGIGGLNVYDDNITAAGVLNGIYINMSRSQLSNDPPTNNALAGYTGLSADELTLFSGIGDPYEPFYRNSLTNTSTPNLWNATYTTLYTINSAIEALSKTGGSLTEAVRVQLLGEAKFLRAYNYLYLAQLYGNVPIVTSTDPKINATISQSPQLDVFAFAIEDLKAAQSLLTDTYKAADAYTDVTERLRPNKWGATALLARAYLYAKDYPNAEAQATEVINQTALYGLPTPDVNFLKESTEAIWQLQPVQINVNTQEGRYFIIPESGFDFSHPVYLSDPLVSSFETGDLRKTLWTGIFTDPGTLTEYTYANKYKNPGLDGSLIEYQIVLRLAEQYLIRSEARAMQGQFAAAAQDLNVIRERAGLNDYTGALNEDALMTAILHERQVELFAENHRWIDLKRTGKVDEVMTSVTQLKGGTWNTDWQWYPIHEKELLVNQHLQQNNGY